mgnify:FL=1
MAATETATAVIEAEGLVKRYGDLRAVDGVSFAVRPGEVFGLLGPNGAGKTTTMEMLEGLRTLDEGTARIAGFDVRRDLRRVKEVIGVQLQLTSLFELLTVEEIVRLYASFYRKTVPIGPLLEDVMLTEKRRDRVKHLSGGQKQRLAIALALVNDPAVVFLDEPTTGLDPQARRSLWDIIRRLKERGKTVVLSTHYMDEAEALCDRICLMDRGRVIALDTPRALVRMLRFDSAVEFRLPGGDAVAETEASAEEHLARIDGVTRVIRRDGLFVLYTDRLEETLAALVRWSAENGFALRELATRTATLEDVFLHLTGRGLREP